MVHREIESVTINNETYAIGDEIGYDLLHWSSDWNGDEAGYDELPVVGLYSFPNTEIYLYLNVEDSTILEMWESGDE